ncbi:uncharacterized protein TA21165 [Theileria annulata]|uniref:Palmitoyltransferase n=1 Tax=Theileria annulata TaxID=5874 RepID=Q4UGS3_THEAN|nr:uncharacterized protein TA21165 [Theileria annulata]CAI73716.1 hypothetical protein TA21165 [Theileria annulata]|eukprot:XP_954393.1 hypothetical protein TA21165 [Theileria annulata]
MNSDGYIPVDSEFTLETPDKQTNPLVIKSIVFGVILHLIILLSYIIKHNKDKTNKSINITIVLLLYFLKLYTLRRLNKSDPGVIPSNTDLSEYLETNTQAKLIDVDGHNFLQKWCRKSNSFILINSFRKILSNCIGHNNYKNFVFFIFLVMVIKEYSFVLLFKIIKVITYQPFLF